MRKTLTYYGSLRDPAQAKGLRPLDPESEKTFQRRRPGLIAESMGFPRFFDMFAKLHVFQLLTFFAFFLILFVFLKN